MDESIAQFFDHWSQPYHTNRLGMIMRVKYEKWEHQKGKCQTDAVWRTVWQTVVVTNAKLIYWLLATGIKLSVKRGKKEAK